MFIDEKKEISKIVVLAGIFSAIVILGGLVYFGMSGIITTDSSAVSTPTFESMPTTTPTPFLNEILDSLD